MKISKKLSGSSLVITLEGRLDSVTVPEVEKELNDSIDAASKLKLDFKKLEYISSAGLRALLAVHKTMSRKGGMKIVNVNEIVKEVFDVTGFTEILDIE